MHDQRLAEVEVRDQIDSSPRTLRYLVPAYLLRPLQVSTTVATPPAYAIVN